MTLHPHALNIAILCCTAWPAMLCPLPTVKSKMFCCSAGVHQHSKRSRPFTRRIHLLVEVVGGGRWRGGGGGGAYSHQRMELFFKFKFKIRILVQVVARRSSSGLSVPSGLPFLLAIVLGVVVATVVVSQSATTPTVAQSDPVASQPASASGSAAVAIGA